MDRLKICLVYADFLTLCRAFDHFYMSGEPAIVYFVEYFVDSPLLFVKFATIESLLKNFYDDVVVQPWLVNCFLL